MLDDTIVHTFNSSPVHLRVADGYINLNQMSEAAGKRIDNWTRLQETQDLIAEFELQQNSNPSDLRDLKPALITLRGQGGGTWAHPDIAIQFAQWCSPVFALQVSRWVRQWMTTGQNPLADIDRVGLRDALKDDSRLRMTDQVKAYLEQIKRYDDKKYRGQFFAQVHDALNIKITGETSKQMKERLSTLLGKAVKENELIRDYFPALPLQRYIALCEATTNLMIKNDHHPLTAVEEAAEIVLPANYRAEPINFVEHIKRVRQRLAFESLDDKRSNLYRRLADK